MLSRCAVSVLLSGLVACSSGEAPPEESVAVAPPVEAVVEPLPPTPDQAVADVVLITLDTLRADALGFMGNRRVATPALDRLAESGWVFDNARAHNVVTLPSHANILTGRHPYEHGVRDNNGFVLPASVPTAATLLSEAGFATAAFVAAFPLDSRFGLDRGFDVYDDDFPGGSRTNDLELPQRSGAEVVRLGLEWWRSTSGRRFLWLHLYEPHAPYLPPEPFASRHSSEPYLGEVEATDSYLAPLLAQITKSSERPVLIALTSDHGEALGDHGEVTHGLFAYEETIHVPLVVWGSGLGAGRTRTAARHVDLLPTLLEASGVEIPPEVAGRSLFSGGDDSVVQYFESLTPTFSSGFAPLRGVVASGFKFISLPLPELYDLGSDPDESRNLVETEMERVRELARKLPVESQWPPRRGEVSAEAAAALRSLGYLAGETVDETSYGPEDDPKRVVELDRKVHDIVDRLQRGDLGGAERLAREVIAVRPKMAMAWSYLAQALLDGGRTGEAIDVMREANGRGFATESLRRQLGLSLADVGRYQEANAVLETFGGSDDPDVLNARGLVLSEAGRQAEARAVLEKVLEVDPRYVAALENLALVALREERWREAAQRAEAALAVDDRLGQAWNYLGTARYNLGDPAGAVKAWERAAEVDAESWDSLYNLALVAGQIGDRARARRALEQFVAGAPPERYGPDLDRARSLLRQLDSG